MSIRVGLIGLGAMGLPMGKRLLEQGFALAASPHSNRAPALELAELGATVVSQARELGEMCDVVITCVPDSPHVEDALFGEGGLATGGGSGYLHIDMSTIAPAAERAMNARLAALGIESIDAPVSGGPLRAADGTLTIMAGGKPEHFDKARPVLEKLGSNVIYVGESGAGQVVKLANQLMIAIIMIANAEALSLGVKSGVPLETLVKVIGTSSGSNYLMQNWLPKTLFSGNLSSGFALDLLIKDLRAGLNSARQLGIPAFGGALAEQLYTLVRSDETGRSDYSVVARIYEEAAGLELRLGDNSEA
jgi:3-hydroxyisobutyrate dehydrogenase-like beta-hydroxyacid dehydrogenase